MNGAKLGRKRTIEQTAQEYKTIEKKPLKDLPMQASSWSALGAISDQFKSNSEQYQVANWRNTPFDSFGR